MLHLVELVVDKFPESSDLYSELSHVHRIAKVSDQLSISKRISSKSGLYQCKHFESMYNLALFLIYKSELAQ